MGLQQIGDFRYNLLSDLEWGRYICRLVLNAEVESPIVWIHTIILTHAESEGSSAIVQISMVLISQILHYWYIRHTVQEKSKQQKDDDAKWRGAKLYWRNPWDSSSDWGHSEKKKKKKKKRMMTDEGLSVLLRERIFFLERIHLQDTEFGDVEGK
jgi:hypothetical protein